MQKYPEWLISIFNQAYQDFLRTWVIIDWKHINLFSVFFKREEDEELFDEHFHEYSTWASWEPLLFNIDDKWSYAFCKTARKSYDVAVVLTLHLASVVLDKSYSSDGRVIYTFWQLEEYIKDELDCSWNYIYDLQDLENLFDIWLNKAIAFCDENKDAMEKVDDMKQYSRVSDLPDSELEYIGEQIKKGNTTIYLNNWQVVRISFE